MSIGVSEFARVKGISRSRVLQLIQQGEIRASKVGSQWVIDNSQLRYRGNLSRPLNPKMAKALLQVLSGEEVPADLDPSEKSRIRDRVVLIKNTDDPAQIIRSWLRNRAQKVELSANPEDLQKLRISKKIVLSGVSSSKSKISDSNFVEAYIEESFLKDFKKKYLLVDSDKPNVILHLVQELVKDPLPIGYLIADLSEHLGSREKERVKELVREL